MIARWRRDRAWCLRAEEHHALCHPPSASDIPFESSVSRRATARREMRKRGWDARLGLEWESCRETPAPMMHESGFQGWLGTTRNAHVGQSDTVSGLSPIRAGEMGNEPGEKSVYQSL